MKPERKAVPTSGQGWRKARRCGAKEASRKVMDRQGSQPEEACRAEPAPSPTQPRGVARRRELRLICLGVCRFDFGLRELARSSTPGWAVT